MVGYCIWMSSYPLLLAGNDASAFISVCARVSVCQEEYSRGRQSGLVLHMENISKKSLCTVRTKKPVEHRQVCVSWAYGWHRKRVGDWSPNEMSKSAITALSELLLPVADAQRTSNNTQSLLIMMTKFGD